MFKTPSGSVHSVETIPFPPSLPPLKLCRPVLTTPERSSDDQFGRNAADSPREVFGASQGVLAPREQRKLPPLLLLEWEEHKSHRQLKQAASRRDKDVH